ncbi:VWA domain-containing protein [Polaribacter sp. KT 15]|uniref:VWA domain-containing protein n=1 Tax=Polaribacter sp. KT 15 TaxID=1896175 RepID=UPI001E352CC2|nr:VWA domain-containing protein [Polaribacter sp. KT 15]
MRFFKDENKLENVLSKLKTNEKLQSKFNIETFLFDKTLKVSDSVDFKGNETNINKSLKALNQLNKKENAPIILLSDGNQTIGNDYEFINSKQKIYSVVFGDTTKYKDLKISQINVNKYSYIKNKFPVEVILNYDGLENVNSIFKIYNNGKTVFSKKVKFNKNDNSKIITTNLTSLKEGINYYTATLDKIENEKNTRNNRKNFSVEVIDEQSKVLILSSIKHPDIGVLKKAIESNKQRSATLEYNINKNIELNDFQLIILYNLNNQFKSIISNIKANNLNFLLINGINSDWNFINRQQFGFSKKVINQTENYAPILNNSFLTFLQKDIGFNEMPPLVDKFGEITFSKDYQNLLFQNINGLNTEQPLISFLEENNQKIGVIFGEGLWKWRASNYLLNNSFTEFDQFIGNIVQYLSSQKKRARLDVNSENLYPANSLVNITAFYTDKNYKFDARASLEIIITNKETKKNTKLPFSLINNSYQVSFEDLESGDYTYKVSVLGQKINKYGSFKITDYEVEEQFTSANVKKLEKLANKTGGKLYHKNNHQQLIKDLLNDSSYFTIQKSIVKEQNLVNWKWILLLVVILFTSEWFIRKYFGKI